MKIKLLIKISDRFRWEFVPGTNPIHKIQVKVFDKRAISFIFMPLKQRLNYQFHTWNITDVTPAEEMTALVLGSWSFIKKHREKLFKRKNKTFVNQNW